MSNSSRPPLLHIHRVKLEAEISRQISSQHADASSAAEPDIKPEMYVRVRGNAAGNPIEAIPNTMREAQRDNPSHTKFELQLERRPSTQPNIPQSSARAHVLGHPVTLYSEKTKQSPHIQFATIGDANGRSCAPLPTAPKRVGVKKKPRTKEEPVVEHPPPAQPDSFLAFAIANPLQPHSTPPRLVKPEVTESSVETAMDISPLSSIKPEILSAPAQESEPSHCLQTASAENVNHLPINKNLSLQSSTSRGRFSSKAEGYNRNDANLRYQPLGKDEQAFSTKLELFKSPIYSPQAHEYNRDEKVDSVALKLEGARESLVGRVEQHVMRAKSHESMERSHIKGIERSKNKMPEIVAEYRRSGRKRSRTPSGAENSSSQVIFHFGSDTEVRAINDRLQVVHPSDVMEDIKAQTAPEPLEQNTRVRQFAMVAERVLSALCTYAKTSGIDSPKKLKKRDFSILAKDAIVLYQSVRGNSVGCHEEFGVGVRSQLDPVDDVTRKDVVKDNETVDEPNSKEQGARRRQGSNLPEQVVNVVDSFMTTMCEFSKKSDGRPRKKLKPNERADFIEQAVTVSESVRDVQRENGANDRAEQPDGRVKPMEVSKPVRSKSLRGNKTEIRPREAVRSSSNRADNDVEHVKRIFADMNDIARGSEHDALQKMWKVSKPLTKMINLVSADERPSYFSNANMVQLFLHFGHATKCIQFLVDQADRSVTGGLLKPPVTLLRVVEWGYEVTSRLENYFDICFKRRNDALERIKLRDTMLRFRADVRDVRTAGVKSVTESMKQLHSIAGEARKINLGYQEDWDMMFSDTRRIRSRMLTMCHRAYEDLYGKR